MNWNDFFPVPHGQPRPVTRQMMCELPTQGRAERAHLYLWIKGEEEYVAGKFDDQRDGHDESLRVEGMGPEGFWFRQIVQYYDRARIFFEEAASIRSSCSPHEELSLDEKQKVRELEMRGQQALAKGFMTAKGCVESSIRVFGPLPKPGLSSGYIEEWT